MKNNKQSLCLQKNYQKLNQKSSQKNNNQSEKYKNRPKSCIFNDKKNVKLNNNKKTMKVNKQNEMNQINKNDLKKNNLNMKEEPSYKNKNDLVINENSKKKNQEINKSFDYTYVQLINKKNEINIGNEEINNIFDSQAVALIENMGEIEKLKNELFESKKLNDSLEKKIKQLNNENLNLSKKIDNLEKTFNDTKNKEKQYEELVQDLNKQIEYLTSKNQNLEKELENEKLKSNGSDKNNTLLKQSNIKKSIMNISEKLKEQKLQIELKFKKIIEKNDITNEKYKKEYDLFESLLYLRNETQENINQLKELEQVEKSLFINFDSITYIEFDSIKEIIIEIEKDIKIIENEVKNKLENTQTKFTQIIKNIEEIENYSETYVSSLLNSAKNQVDELETISNYFQEMVNNIVNHQNNIKETLINIKDKIEKLLNSCSNYLKNNPRSSKKNINQSLTKRILNNSKLFSLKDLNSFYDLNLSDIDNKNPSQKDDFQNKNINNNKNKNNKLNDNKNIPNNNNINIAKKTSFEKIKNPHKKNSSINLPKKTNKKETKIKEDLELSKKNNSNKKETEFEEEEEEEEEYIQPELLKNNWEQITTLTEDGGQEIEIKFILKAVGLSPDTSYTKWYYTFDIYSDIQIIFLKINNIQNEKPIVEEHLITFHFKLKNNEELPIHFKYKSIRKDKNLFYNKLYVGLNSFLSEKNAKFTLICPEKLSIIKFKKNLFKEIEKDKKWFFEGKVPDDGLTTKIGVSLTKAKWKLILTNKFISSQNITNTIFSTSILFEGGNNKIISNEIESSMGNKIDNKIIKKTKEKYEINFKDLKTKECYFSNIITLQNSTNYKINLNNIEIKIPEDEKRNKLKFIETVNKIFEMDKSEEEKYIKIAKYVKKIMKYKISYIGKNLTASEILEKKEGVSEHYTILLNALLNSIGIDALYVTVHCINEVKNEKDGNHVWSICKINNI